MKTMYEFVKQAMNGDMIIKMYHNADWNIEDYAVVIVDSNNKIVGKSNMTQEEADIYFNKAMFDINMVM